jgi:hypothetical protein
MFSLLVTKIITTTKLSKLKLEVMRIKLGLPDIEQSLGLVFTSVAIAVDVFYKECYGYGNR